MSIENIDVRLVVSEAGLTYRQIAKQMNLTPEYLSKVMRNQLKPKMKERIIEAINVLRGGDVGNK